MPPADTTTAGSSGTGPPVTQRRRSAGRGRGSPGAAPAPGSPAAELAARPGLRIRPRQPLRALIGAFVVVAAVTAALAIYSSLGDRDAVLVLRSDVAAGHVIDDIHVTTAAIATDDVINTLSPADREWVVGSYATADLKAGTLLAAELIQTEPLVSGNAALIGVPIPAGQLPVGLRAQTRIVLVVLLDDDRAARGAAIGAPDRADDIDGAVAPGLAGDSVVLVEALVTDVPAAVGALVAEADRGSALVTLSVEVSRDAVAVVAAADAVSIAVFDPDPGDVHYAFPETDDADEPDPAEEDPAAEDAPAAEGGSP